MHVIAVNILSDNSWIGTVYLAKLVQPNLFQDLDPRELHQEYLTRFLGLDFDIYKQGLFSISCSRGLVKNGILRTQGEQTPPPGVETQGPVPIYAATNKSVR